ncbi:hypothetical protein C8T65DRAFT_777947, partial [Cerioporus squamosus]
DAGRLPTNLSGFFYYHQPPRAPLLVGELRFRLTATHDPASFPSGVDLTTRRGVPWYIPLPVIAFHKKYAPIRHLLTTVDATVPQRTMDRAREHRQLFRTGDVSGTRYLHTFGQPFGLHLDSTELSFVFAGKGHIAHTRIQNIPLAVRRTLLGHRES